MIHYILRCYPNYNSTASYNRVRLISEGFVKNGIPAKIDFLFFKHRKNRILNVIEEYLFSYVRFSFQFLQLLRRVDKNDVVIIYDFIEQYWVLRLFGKKTNLIVDLTEYPFFERNNDEISWFRKHAYTFYNKKFLNCLKNATLLITCSSYLERYYKKYNNKIYILPLVVDLDYLASIKSNNNVNIGEYIAYCGSFINNKDGLPILIESFKKFHDLFPQVKLVLIGTGPQSVVDNFKEIIRKYGLSNSVLFTGSLPHDEVCVWLSGATILALARPNTKQAEGGIPSKVGEYLASGVPCVITKTGDLPNYLHDGEDCFLCLPDSIDAFAQRLVDCYLSEKEVVGRNAIKTANQFNNVIQAKSFIDYLQNNKILYLKQTFYETSCIDS